MRKRGIELAIVPPRGKDGVTSPIEAMRVRTHSGRAECQSSERLARGTNQSPLTRTFFLIPNPRTPPFLPMAPQQPTLLSPSELSYLHTSLSLQPPIRPDARSPTSFRPLVAETDLLPSANGSARLCFADGIEAIVGVKAEVERTGNARSTIDIRGEDEEMKGMMKDDVDDVMGKGEDEWVEITVDIPGQRDDDAVVVFLGQMIHEGLVADGGLRRRCVINGRWHWRLYVDVCNSILLVPIHSPHHISILGIQIGCNCKS